MNVAVPWIFSELETLTMKFQIAMLQVEWIKMKPPFLLDSGKDGSLDH